MSQNGMSCKNGRWKNNTVPIIYTRGTHYEVGFNIGKTFAEMIRNHVDRHKALNESYLALYNTEEGKKVYDETLASSEKQFPQYVREIRGTADGAGVPFYKLFLMHLEEVLPNVVTNGAQGNREDVGCSVVICNQPGQEILGHNEDGLIASMNLWYLIDAHVIEPNLPEEKFCSLSFAGILPGFGMGYNHHGLVFTINALHPKTLRSGKTGRFFLTRALLGAKNYGEVRAILRNDGYGAAEGFAVTLTFYQEEIRLFHNIEVAPVEKDQNCSQLSVLVAGPGAYFYHCNKYRRLTLPEDDVAFGNIHKEEAIAKHPKPRNALDVIKILSDETNHVVPVYARTERCQRIRTIATGIFDFVNKTWTIYTDRPDCNEPLVVIPLQFKNDLQNAKSSEFIKL